MIDDDLLAEALSEFLRDGAREDIRVLRVRVFLFLLVQAIPCQLLRVEVDTDAGTFRQD